MQYTLSSRVPSLAYLVSSLMMLVKAVSVFPDPVGDDTRTLRLWWITGMALACGMVRSSYFSLNQVEIRGSIMSMTSSFEYVLSTFSTIGNNRSTHYGIK